MELNKDKDAPQIEYPCEWKYKIIGEDLENMLNTIDDVIEGLEADLSPSNISTKGKYYSLNLKVYVKSEEQRNSIYHSLKLCPSIKIVL